MADAFLRVHLCRHGQSANNVLAAHSAGAYNTGRFPDAPLTDTGRVQARAVGRYLAATASAVPVPLVQIYTSAFERALETSVEIVKSMSEALDVALPAADTASPLAHLSPRLWVDLHEVGGVFSHVHDAATGAPICFAGSPGMTRSALQERFPSVRVPDDGSIDERGWWRSPNKETKDEGAARVRRVLSELLQAAAELPYLPALSVSGVEGAGKIPAQLLAAAGSAPHAAFDLRRHLRPSSAESADESKLGSGAGAGAGAGAENGNGKGNGTPDASLSIPVPEAFDSAGSTASSVRFHRSHMAGAVDRRGSGGDSDHEVSGASPAASPAPGAGTGSGSGAAASASASSAPVSLEELSRLRKYTQDGRLKLTGASFASAGISSGRSMAVMLVCHGDLIETMLRLIAAFKPSGAAAPAAAAGAAGRIGAGAMSAGDADATAAALAVAAQTMGPAQFCHHNCAISTFDIFPDGAIRLVRINDVSPLVFGSQMAVQSVARPIMMTMPVSRPGVAEGAEAASSGSGSETGSETGSSRAGAVYMTDLLTGGPIV